MITLGMGPNQGTLGQQKFWIYTYYTTCVCVCIHTHARTHIYVCVLCVLCDAKHYIKIIVCFYKIV